MILTKVTGEFLNARELLLDTSVGCEFVEKFDHYLSDVYCGRSGCVIDDSSWSEGFCESTYGYSDEQGSRKLRLLNSNHINYILELVRDELMVEKDTSRMRKLQMLHENLVVLESDLSEERVSQIIHCKQEMKLRNKTLYCTICGHSVPVNKKSARQDKQDSESKNTSYEALKHFETIFKSMFVEESEDIPGEVKEELESFMLRDEKQRVSIEDVRQYLKQLSNGRGSKLNKLDAAIMQELNGESAVKLSTKEYNFIRDLYHKCVSIFYQTNTERNNTPSASYIIKCILELLYKDYDPKRYSQLIKLIHIQKEQTIQKIQKTWHSIQKELNVSEIKCDFKNMMNSKQ